MNRALFTDGGNSIAHFVLGYLAKGREVIIPFFLAHQWMETNQINTIVDIMEFVVGYLFSSIKNL